MTPLELSSLVAHLWQSTLFAALVWAAACALRANGARVRYWLWTAASVKFAVPVAWLVGLGERVQWRTAPAVARPAASFVFDEVLTPPALAPAVSSASSSLPPPADALTWMLAGAWLAGTIAVVAWWWHQWRPIRAALRQASPLHLGPGVDTTGIVVKSSPSAFEPGVVGIRRPVLLLPAGLADRLTPGQLNALVAHERCHIRCHDNLAAALHMAIEAVFWFHPLVWWIERRMIDERERACDEAVLRSGSTPQDYAEGILEVCRSSMESPLACVAGVGGANLRRRIESIASGHLARPLTTTRRVGLTVATTLVLAIPIGTGVVIGGQDVIVSPDPAVPVSFEVAAVRRNTSGSDSTNFSWPPGGGYNATNASLWTLITTAYQLQQNQLVNAPDWIRRERFDITARLEREPPPVPRGEPDARRLALRTLLADRFRLVVRREVRAAPMYALVMVTEGKPGPRLTRSTTDCSPEAVTARLAPAQQAAPLPGVCGSIFTGSTIRFGGVMSEFARALPTPDGRPVVDRTGLTGNWDVELTYTRSADAADPGQPQPPVDLNAPPPFFTALHDQLGLKLEPITGRLEVLVIDRVERLTEDRIAAQEPASAPAAFDVVSIRENRLGATGGGGGPRPDGRYTLTNVAARTLIAIAYETPSGQVLGGPDWLATTRYDIAGIGKANPTEAESQAMLQAMLRDRFQLRAHVEQRDLPVYFLVTARSDGRLGPNVRPAAVNCGDFEAAKKALAAAREAGARAPCGITFEQARYLIGGERLSMLEPILSSASGRPVLDRTGLAGSYDIELAWNRADAERPDGVSIFTAVQEQLGLRLEPGTAPLDVVVVDRIERPSEN